MTGNDRSALFARGGHLPAGRVTALTGEPERVLTLDELEECYPRFLAPPENPDPEED